MSSFSRRGSLMPKPPPTHLINHEELAKTEERMLRGPTKEAWKKIGVRKHYGVCVPMFGLKTKESCGVGEFLDLIPLADFCATIKFDVIQLLPLNDINTDNSPFSPISAFALNPLFLSLTKLPHFDKQTEEMKGLSTELQAQNKNDRVDWTKLRQLKEKWLHLYAELPESKQLLQSEAYTNFLKESEYWIESYALFRALKKKNDRKFWGDWPETHQMDKEAYQNKFPTIAETATYKKLLTEYANDITFFQFLQHLCTQQLVQAKEYATSKGVWLKGDVPFLCSKDSADAWVYRNCFLQEFSAGAPPDMYSKDGQDWGLPLYNWPELEKTDYKWWKERLLSAAKYFQIYRIDHIVGFYRVWAVPKGKKASEGGYQPADKNLWIPQGEKILRIMCETTDMLPIGEDLGSIPKEVYLNLQKLGICGTRVIRWERQWERKEEGQPFIPIDDYIPDSMTTVSTHDCETVPIWWVQLVDEAKAYCNFKRWSYKILDLKGAPPDNSEFKKLNGKTIPINYLEDILRDSNNSASLFHINLLSEYLSMFPPNGDKPGLVHWNPVLERVNVPGTVQATNWSYRLLPNIEDLVEHKDLHAAIERTRHPAEKPATPLLQEKKPLVYTRHYISKLPEKLRVLPGKSYPLGATWDGAGVNFAIFSEFGSQAYVCLFDSPDSTQESHRIKMPEYDDFVYHCYLPDIRPGQLYGFRVEGDWDPQNGLRFNSNKVLLDPYAKAIGRDVTWDDSLFPYNMHSHSRDKDLEMNHSDNSAFCPLSAVIDSSFTWGNDAPPNIPWHKTVIYETHVKNITQMHPEIPEHIRGTYAGLCFEPVIQHLKKMGVTAVELMPIHHHVDEKNLLDKGLKNHWGYNTLSFFAPDLRFCATTHVLGAVQEFKTMVRVLHSHGIEVILDVVYNHTAEGNHFGPMFSFKGADNLAYYKVVEGDERYYFDYTGCGNSLNVRHPRVLQLIMDSLRYWIQEMHVDGFRFDLASALARHFYDVDKLGAFFDIIHQDPVISRVKLIAEPWDVGAGGYQVGNFPVLWTEWNGKYRDSVRGFWNGKGVNLGELATRITGSSDLYSMDTGRSALASINFVTCHDGFNLVDLVSYNEKHNEANGENNRDGANDNHSWNHGTEGETDNEGILEFRWRQRANMLATLFLSLGVPMMLSGDELSMTQGGNNNTYCQDNEITWLDWELDNDADDFLNFTKKLIAIRHSNPVLQRRRHLVGEDSKRGRDVTWYMPDGREPNHGDWTDSNRRCLGWVMDGNAIGELSETGGKIVGDTLLILLNGQFENVHFKLPGHSSGRPWQLQLSSDRSLKSRISALYAPGEEFLLKDHSIAVFQLHVHVQRIARRMSRITLNSPLRRQMDMAENVSSPDALHIRIPGADGKPSSPDFQAAQRLEVPKR